VLISAAGPGAGYVLAAVTIAILYALGGHIEWQPLVGLFPIPIPHAHLGENLGAARDNLNLRIFLDMILWFNVVWGTVNLLPVFPLDGGQIAQSLMVASDPWGGLVRSLWLSIITGVGMAIVGYVVVGVLRSPALLTYEGISVSLIVVGLLVIFISVVRERYHEHKHDPYKEVER